MSDELTYLQKDFASIASDAGSDGIVYSVNFYRDEGDDYVVRDYGFTNNISSALDLLKEQRADGGGDYPEAVTAALLNGISGHDWREDSEKLMFLVLDAPPHDGDAIQQFSNILTLAAQKGIRIIPVASSGVDTDTEFLCRSMAIATGGTYTFLTDDSGIGGSHLEPTIGDYSVEKLNEMLVRIISDYFSQGPRSYNTQSPDSGQQQTQDSQNIAYPAGFSYSTNYFEGEGMYVSGLVTSQEELNDFRAKYGNGIIDRNLDFTERILAYDVVLLGSGSITVDTDKGVTVEIVDGKPRFHYELNIPEVGTADIKTLFILADLPRTALGS
jgi:hypothetical protein